MPLWDKWTNKPPQGTPLDSRLAAALGIVACFPLNEGSGSVVNDVANGAIGVASGGAAWSQGISGPAIALNGSTGYIDVPNSPLLQLTGPLTLYCWFNATTNAQSYCPVIDKENGPGVDSSYYLGIENGDVYFGFNAGGSEIDNSAPTAGTWHNVVGTFTAASSGVALSLYYDGALAATNTTPVAINVTTADLVLGAYLPTNSYFQGSIDLIILANTCWSPSLVQAMYADPWRIFAPPPFYSFLRSATNVNVTYPHPCNPVFEFVLSQYDE
jgi:hypothetical protein